MTNPVLNRPLLWSLLDLEPIPTNVIKAVQPSTILEVGVGDFSKHLHDLTCEIGGRLTSIDVRPSYRHSGTIVGKSLDVFGDWFMCEVSNRPSFDVAVIDGDHNYYTVIRELEAVYELNPRAVCILHDVGWPCGRRDFYYDPPSIPAEFRHEHSWNMGVVPTSWIAPGEVNDDGLRPWGFRGNGAFAVATHEGGPKNGVMTAVEDFVAARRPGLEDDGEWRIWSIPSVFGMAVLRPPPQHGASRGTTPLDEVCCVAAANMPLLKRLEQNRIELYLGVLKNDYERGQR